MGTAKTINKEINHYLEQLNIHQKEVVLSVVKTFAHEESEWWGHVEGDALGSINKGLKQAKEGDIISHDEVMRRYKK